MVTWAYWTPRALYYRMRYWNWLKKNPESPWIAPDAAVFLEHWFKPTDKGFEFGSGRSTAWIAEQVAHITSIEKNREWYEKVKVNLENSKQNNWELILEELIDSDHVDDYTKVLRDQNDNSLDFVVNDADHRDIVTRDSISKIKPGGILVLDNSERYLPIPYSNTLTPASEFGNELWRELWNELQYWRVVHFSYPVVSATSIYVKPGND